MTQVPRALPLARLVKLWARSEKLNKAYDGYLNSLGWTVLVIFWFLDTGDASSSYFDMEEPSERVVDGEDSLPPPLHGVASFESPEDALSEMPSLEDVAAFFSWLVEYASSWPVEDDPDTAWCISAVDGLLVQVPRTGKQYPDQAAFWIEDPGIRLAKGTSENIARSLKAPMWQETLHRCRDAARTLSMPAAAASWVRSLLPTVVSSVVRPTPKLRAGNMATKRPLLEALEPVRVTYPPPAKKGRKDICKWYQEGQCWSGDRCSKSHDIWL